MGRLSTDSLRLLAFGFAFSFFSSFGQTYYVAVYGGEFRAAFDLTHGGFGAVYSVATLASGILMIRVGGLMDTVSLRLYAAAAVLGLALACLTCGLASGVVSLTLAMFMLRLFGQGMLSHAAVTAMARSFDKARGRAISFASLGNPVGQAVFPALGVLALGISGWREAWFAGAFVCIAAVLPVALVLLRPGLGDPLPQSSTTQFVFWRFLMRRDVALALPALMTPAFVGTAIFFHQVMIAEEKGWNVGDFALGFVVFSVGSVVSMAVAGAMVDRLTARRVARHYLTPSAVGCIVLASSDSFWALHMFMILSSITFGASATVTSSLFAEVFGRNQLGSIRATVMAVGVVSSALSPVLMGASYDAGVSVAAIITAMAVLTGISGIMLAKSELTAPGSRYG